MNAYKACAQPLEFSCTVRFYFASLHWLLCYAYLCCIFTCESYQEPDLHYAVLWQDTVERKWAIFAIFSGYNVQ